MKGYFKARCSFTNLWEMSLLLNGTLKALQGEKKKIKAFLSSIILTYLGEVFLLIRSQKDGLKCNLLFLFKNLISSDDCEKNWLQLGCWCAYTTVYDTSRYIWTCVLHCGLLVVICIHLSPLSLSGGKLFLGRDNSWFCVATHIVWLGPSPWLRILPVSEQG